MFYSIKTIDYYLMLFNINKSLDFAYDNKIYTESIRLTTLTIDSVLFITYRFELNRLNTITAVQ